MQYMTVITEDYFINNFNVVQAISQTGVFAPLELHGVASGTTYKVTKGIAHENAYIPEEILDDEEIIIDGIKLAFADLIAGNIPAISMSVGLFLKLQQRPEFSPDSTVTIFLKTFTSTEDLGQLAPTNLVGTMPYKVTLNSDWEGNIFEPDLTKSVSDVTTDLLTAFDDLMDGTIEAIRMPVAVFLQVQEHQAFD